MAKPHMALDPANFSLSIVMLLLVGVEGGLITELLKGDATATIKIASVVILILVAALGVLLSERLQVWLRRNRQFQRIEVAIRVARARALIVFVSKGGGRTSARDAALYHAGDGVLRQLWLVTSADAIPDAEWVKGEVERRWPDVEVHPPACVSDIYSVVDAKEEIERIRKWLKRKGLAENDIICDFTGMTKHMSAGMILACGPREARLQYMHPKRLLEDGRADPSAGPSEPVELEIAYQVEDDS